MLTVEVAHRYRVCFSGFYPEQQSIHVRVTGPDGQDVRSQDVQASNGGGTWFLTALLEDPLGDYSFVASQPPPEGQTEPRTASGSFTVVSADDPAIITVVGSGPPGTTFRFALAGFAPGSEATLYLYEQKDSAWVFQTELPPAAMDDEGEANYDLATRVDDPPGMYGILTDPPARFQPPNIGGATFVVSS